MTGPVTKELSPYLNKAQFQLISSSGPLVRASGQRRDGGYRLWCHSAGTNPGMWGSNV